MPSFQEGGPVDTSGLAMVHGGEYVVPKGGALVASGGGGGGNSQSSANMQALTNAISRLNSQGLQLTIIMKDQSGRTLGIQRLNASSQTQAVLGGGGA